MHESLKSICVVVFMAAAIFAAIVWFHDRPDQTIWNLRIGATVTVVIAVGVFLRLEWKRDRAPDILFQYVGKYFERNGFCFVIAPDEVDGVFSFRVLFQNRYERDCVALIALRPVKFVHKLEPVMIAVRCPGGACGEVRRFVGLPWELQGKKVSLDIGADVVYPEGKGRTLRFKDATVIRRNSKFVDAFARTTTVLALLGGMLLFHRPVRANCILPNNVATDLPTPVADDVTIFWLPDDEVDMLRR